MFDVSADHHLLFDDVPRRPLHAPEDALGDRLAIIGELWADDFPHSSLLNVATARWPRAGSELWQATWGKSLSAALCGGRPGYARALESAALRPSPSAMSPP